MTSLISDLEMFIFISGDDGVSDGIGLGIFGLDRHDPGELGRVLVDRGLVQELVEHRAS